MTADKPRRVQLSRAKGWRMPENTVKVDRTTRWGNPYKIGGLDHENDIVETASDAKHAFSVLRGEQAEAHDEGHHVQIVADIRRDLRGKNLACWCRLDQPCHADVLLELANKTEDTAHDR
ncbi:DUF4326 domain-containing protein [Brevundimonas diminuta]|uniref:DUF4326 domain-containing protein n=1 Tax=Brevundimonas diminuta TaxID=293 RepID=UPI003209D4A1